MYAPQSRLPVFDEEKAYARMRSILERLIAFNTASPEPTRPAIEWIAKQLKAAGLHIDCVPSASNPEHHAGLVATLGPAVDGGLAFSGHVDVVPADPTQWRTPPFVLTEKDGLFYGRGTTDMKGFLACTMATLMTWAEAGYNPAKPVQLIITHDEETSFKSVQEALAQLGNTIPKPATVIVGEPTNHRLITNHKGSTMLTFAITGKEAHSSDPAQGINAIEIAMALGTFALNLRDAAMKAPPHPAYTPGYTTYNIGTLHGGSAGNITAGHATMKIQFRPIHEGEAERVVALFRTEAERLTRVFTNASGDRPVIALADRIVPPLVERAGNAARALVMRLTGTNEVHAVPFATEAAYFNIRGIDAVVCGPGAIAQAHQRDEFVAPAELKRSLAFLHAALSDHAQNVGPS